MELKESKPIVAEHLDEIKAFINQLHAESPATNGDTDGGHAEGKLAKEWIKRAIVFFENMCGYNGEVSERFKKEIKKTIKRWKPNHFNCGACPLCGGYGVILIAEYKFGKLTKFFRRPPHTTTEWIGGSRKTYWYNDCFTISVDFGAATYLHEGEEDQYEPRYDECGARLEFKDYHGIAFTNHGKNPLTLK